MRDLTDLVRQATSQDGLLTTAQLRSLGFNRSAQFRLAAIGVLASVHRGVHRLVGSEPTWRQAVRAAALAAGHRSAASHRSALRIWDLRTVDPQVEIAIPYPSSCRLVGVTVHRSVDLVPADVTVREGIPVTTPARTLCDAGLLFPEREVQRMTDHAVATGLVCQSELIGIRRRVGEHGRNGVVCLDQVIDGLPRGADATDSGPEVELLRLILRHELPKPVLQHRVLLGGRSRFIDLAYVDEMVALEYDGNDPHTRVDRFVDDRRRQNELVLAGWKIFRYTNEELRDRPHVVIAQLRTILDL